MFQPTEILNNIRLHASQFGYINYLEGDAEVRALVFDYCGLEISLSEASDSVTVGTH